MPVNEDVWLEEALVPNEFRFKYKHKNEAERQYVLVEIEEDLWDAYRVFVRTQSKFDADGNVTEIDTAGLNRKHLEGSLYTIETGDKWMPVSMDRISKLPHRLVASLVHRLRVMSGLLVDDKAAAAKNALSETEPSGANSDSPTTTTSAPSISST